VVVVDNDGPGVRRRSADFGFGLFNRLSDSGLLAPCQFFPYRTGFGTLAQALNMDRRRAEMAPGYEPWYIGWYVRKETPSVSAKTIVGRRFSSRIFVRRKTFRGQLNGWPENVLPSAVCRLANETISFGERTFGPANNHNNIVRFSGAIANQRP